MSELARLEAFLRHASTHPWYREQHGGTDITRWPVLDKAGLYAKVGTFPQSVTSNTYYSRSGGTTSKGSFYCPTDVRENHLQRARLARRLRADGVLGPDSIALNLMPAMRMYRSMEIFTEYTERCRGTVLTMEMRSSDEDVAMHVRLFGANTLIGLPSRLIGFARYALDQKLDWRCKNLLFAGEFLQAGKRELLRQAFGIEQWSGVYGGAELGVFAWNANVPLIPVYHFPREIVYVEVENPDADGYGNLVITNLLRRRFPIVRFRTNDVGRIVGTESDRVTVELRGRVQDSFQIGDCEYELSDFDSAFAPFAEHQIQIAFDEARRLDTIRFCLVAHGDVSESLAAETSRLIHNVLLWKDRTYLISVDFVRSEELVRGVTAGKVPAIIDRRGR